MDIIKWMQVHFPKVAVEVASSYVAPGGSDETWKTASITRRVAVKDFQVSDRVWVVGFVVCDVDWHVRETDESCTVEMY